MALHVAIDALLLCRLPLQRVQQMLFDKLDLAVPLRQAHTIRSSPHQAFKWRCLSIKSLPAETIGNLLGIAITATLAHARAASYRVPRRISPANARLSSHRYSPISVKP